ncbi:hypothetical protein BKA61DRAFT_588870 [Leptodontidium sp. MPI-SDFR-AT-0119]|nr:hypothetical protein BKA61DRAFT_588870 [Leptodontidium sp. MPI-SDFR-AT-0119]
MAAMAVHQNQHQQLLQAQAASTNHLPYHTTTAQTKSTRKNKPRRNARRDTQRVCIAVRMGLEAVRLTFHPGSRAQVLLFGTLRTLGHFSSNNRINRIRIQDGMPPVQMSRLVSLAVCRMWWRMMRRCCGGGGILMMETRMRIRMGMGMGMFVAILMLRALVTLLGSSLLSNIII